MGKSRRFLSWAAVSSLPQAKKISLEDQLEENRRHAERIGGEIVGELVVFGQSRKIAFYHVAMAKVKGYHIDQHGNREECYPYAKLLELMEAKAFDVLIYLDRSRIGRDAALSMAVVSGCKEAGIRVYELDAPPADLDAPINHQEQLIGAINSVQAQKAVEDIAEKHRKGMKGRALRGEFPAAIPWPRLARYTPEGELYIEIDAQGKATLERIYTLYTERGYSVREICKELNSEGVPAPASGQWKASKVLPLLDQVWTYAGFVEYNRRSATGRPFTRTKSRWPAVISPELARAVEDERGRRAESRQGFRHSKYRFAGMCWCLVCGNKMRSGTLRAKRTDGSEYVNVYYRCDSPRHPGGHIAEHFVYNAVRAVVEHWQQAAYADQLIADDPGNNAEQQIAQRITELRKQESDLLSQIERTDDLAISTNWSKDRYERQIERISSQLARVQGELRELQKMGSDAADTGERLERLEEIKQDGLTYLDHPDPATANTWLRAHLRIYIENGAIVKVTSA